MIEITLVSLCNERKGQRLGINGVRERIDVCIRAAYFSGRIESNHALAKVTAATNASSSELTANV